MLLRMILHQVTMRLDPSKGALLRNAVRTLILLNFSILLFACSVDLPVDVAEAYDALPSELDYNQHVKPVLSDKCYACHGPDKAKQKAGLRLDIRDNAIGELQESPGKFAID